MRTPPSRSELARARSRLAATHCGCGSGTYRGSQGHGQVDGPPSLSICCHRRGYSCSHSAQKILPHIEQSARLRVQRLSHAHRHAHTHSGTKQRTTAEKVWRSHEVETPLCARFDASTSSRSRCSPVRMYRRPCRHRRAPGDGADVVYGYKEFCRVADAQRHSIQCTTRDCGGQR